MSLDLFKEKLIIEALWNEIIFLKYKSKIKIDEKKLKKEIFNNKKKETTSYDLSEIVFNLEKNEQLAKKTKLIENEIVEKGFENTALLYSISSTSSLGGKLGWISAVSLNKKLELEISKLKIGEQIKPFTIPGGFLILKLNNKKQTQKNVDLDQELKKIIKIKTNQQLNQFSNIYFNKLKKNLLIEKI